MLVVVMVMMVLALARTRVEENVHSDVIHSLHVGKKQEESGER